MGVAPSPVGWGGNNTAQNLQGGMQFNNGTGPSILTGTVNPSTTATSAVEGSLYLNQSTAITYQKQDNGSTTNWVALGTSTPVIMQAYMTQQHSASAGTPLGWDGTNIDTAGGMNTSTGMYTIQAGCSGSYYVETGLLLAVQADIGVWHNSTLVGYVSSLTSAINMAGSGGIIVPNCSVGDTIYIGGDGGPTTTSASNFTFSFFNLFRINGSSTGTGSSGITRSINSISTATTGAATAATDYVYLVSGTTTFTLPTAVGNTNLYTVKNTGSNTVTVNTTSSQTMDGSTSLTLTPNTSLNFISDNANWRIT